jgi:hypothetical protein
MALKELLQIGLDPILLIKQVVTKELSSETSVSSPVGKHDTWISPRVHFRALAFHNLRTRPCFKNKNQIRTHNTHVHVHM